MVVSSRMLLVIMDGLDQVDLEDHRMREKRKAATIIQEDRWKSWKPEIQK